MFRKVLGTESAIEFNVPHPDGWPTGVHPPRPEGRGGQGQHRGAGHRREEVQDRQPPAGAQGRLPARPGHAVDPLVEETAGAFWRQEDARLILVVGAAYSAYDQMKHGTGEPSPSTGT